MRVQSEWSRFEGDFGTDLRRSGNELDVPSKGDEVTGNVLFLHFVEDKMFYQGSIQEP